MLSFIIASTVLMSAAECDSKAVKVTPTHTVYEETCTIYAQGKQPVKKVTVFKLPNKNINNGSAPDEFTIPESDRK